MMLHLPESTMGHPSEPPPCGQRVGVRVGVGDGVGAGVGVRVGVRVGVGVGVGAGVDPRRCLELEPLGLVRQ